MVHTFNSSTRQAEADHWTLVYRASSRRVELCWAAFSKKSFYSEKETIGRANQPMGEIFTSYTLHQGLNMQHLQRVQYQGNKIANQQRGKWTQTDAKKKIKKERKERKYK